MTMRGARVAIADIALDRAEALASELDGAIAVRVDLEDEQSIEAMITNVTSHYGQLDMLHNNAALLDPELAPLDGNVEDMGTDIWDRVMAVNLRGTMSLLRAMDGAGCKRVIFSSSATVYGDPVYLPYDEAHPLNPTNVYGRSKLLSEQVISDWANLTGGTGVLLRYFNPVGAHPSAKIGEDPEGIPDNLMPFVAQVAVGKRDKLSVFGDDYDTPDGTGQRDYIHVVDLARAHVAALDYAASATGARPFNIGTGQSYSVLEMIAAFAAASGREIPYEVAPRRAGDIAAMQADPSRATQELGWQAKFDLADMAQSTWDWQRTNPNGYRGDAG
mgnify:CR=1 FL=1